jgi:hypothetical protein
MEDTDAADSSGVPTPASLSPDGSGSRSSSPSSRLPEVLGTGDTVLASTQEYDANTLRQIGGRIEKDRQTVESLKSSLQGLTDRIETLNRAGKTEESSLDAIDRTNAQNARSLKILQIILTVAVVTGIALWIIRAKTIPRF